MQSRLPGPTCPIHQNRRGAQPGSILLIRILTWKTFLMALPRKRCRRSPPMRLRKGRSREPSMARDAVSHMSQEAARLCPLLGEHRRGKTLR